MVIVSTASPYKFPQAVLRAITGHPVDVDGLAAVDQLHDLIQTPIPATVENLRQATVKHDQVTDPATMGTTIKTILKLR